MPRHCPAPPQALGRPRTPAPWRSRASATWHFPAALQQAEDAAVPSPGYRGMPRQPRSIVWATLQLRRSSRGSAGAAQPLYPPLPLLPVPVPGRAGSSALGTSCRHRGLQDAVLLNMLVPHRPPGARSPPAVWGNGPWPAQPAPC